MSESRNSRRTFLVRAATAAVAIPLGIRLIDRPAFAQDLPKLPLDNPQAKALNYVESTEGLTHPNFKPGSDCANCQFWTGGDAEWGPCTLFPGHHVAAKGWCSAWARKAG
ncbi:high-potential iron-sulfur protein [Rehaibacterium terrae]|jgi:hypothetical protein|uniref:High potential iron-sulfur proteins family profile domain-containing protein n=1 Tax=Rehaibacterium terrae TaxID=1341696 RepID=A0A7W7XXL6_9GAMM|nr:high-potential iron-sulfur protein [Rehaibacterium terrae]MBB5014286.1 hypothetical protein [Rehaibacterium terrae]